MSDPEPEYVSPADLRRRFNAERLFERMLAGEFRVRIHKAPLVSRTVRNPKSHLPPGTLSQMVSYLDRRSGEEVARVHQYLLPDGSLFNGRPDPKIVATGGVVWFSGPPS